MSDKNSLRLRLQASVAKGILSAALALPYETRVKTAGRLFTSIIAPLAGWRRRIRLNLSHAWPELPEDRVNQIVAEVPRNVGRMLMEIWSGDEFARRVADTPFTGPGVTAFETARAHGRPVVLVTAHFGNYDALRAALRHRGHDIGSLYKPMTNPTFNAAYLDVISSIGERLYPTSARGIAGLLRFLSGGGIAGIVADVASRKAPTLQFFGVAAKTPVSAAEWALKYDAVMIPVFGRRLPDGLSFELEFKDPVTGDTAEAMMQRVNDVTEQMVRADPEQWFWIHNRWKPFRE